MRRVRAFLIGGGRDPDGVRRSHAPFLAALRGRGPVCALILDEGDATDVARWEASLAPAAARSVIVAAGRPPAPDDVAGCSGVFVAGGLTPAYAEVLAADRAWLDAARAAGLPYAGFSAGAAVAAEQAIVGGWRADGRALCDDGAGEDLDELALRPGLAVVPFLVDVHAAQWGTLGRLLHACAATGREGWAIDEHTCLERDGDARVVHGLGAAHRAVPLADGVLVTAVTAG